MGCPEVLFPLDCVATESGRVHMLMSKTRSVGSSEPMGVRTAWTLFPKGY